MSIENDSELARNEYTEFIYGETCFGEPVDTEQNDITEGIERALQLGDRPAFLYGLCERLNQLGTVCTPDDNEVMLSEVKRRYRTILKKSCPRTVIEWIRGTTPGTNNRQNNYELCYALEMDFNQTSVFFQKNYLTLPFIVKSRTDAVFMYCLYHSKPYSTVAELLERSENFVPQETVHTSTSQIRSAVLSTDDDDKFLDYLSQHCYGKEQQFQLAKSIIKKEIDDVHDIIRSYHLVGDEKVFPNRLNSLTIEALLGYKYQKSDRIDISKLPKRFTESLPNDVTLGKILNGCEVSYELVRKTLILLKFYNFYYNANNCDRDTIQSNLMDFWDELNGVLNSCGFAQIYMCHPFDCLIMYCANSYDPTDALYCIIEKNRNLTVS